MKSVIQPKFGEIYWADLKSDGCIQGGRRPVIIAQNDIGNAHSPTTVVIPLSSQIKSMHLPTHTVIKASSVSGLSKNSVALAEQMRVINRDQLQNRVGELTHAELVAVGKAHSIQSPFPAE